MPSPRWLPSCFLLALACGDGVTATGDTTAGSTDGSSDTTLAPTGTSTDAATTTGGTTSGSTTADDTTAASTGSSTTGAAAPPLGPWRVMTFNIMCAGCKPEGFEDWDDRVPHIGDTIRRHDPDLLGTQELFLGEEVALIEAELPGYTSIWFPAPGPDDFDYADAAIFYRTAMFEEQEHGFYWLSPTPDVPYSNGFATPQFPRLVVWARLRALAEDAEFVFATTHFDNNSPSQELSAPLVVERTGALADQLPVILVGDFNSQPTDEAYTILTAAFADAFVLAADWHSDTNLDPPPAYDPAQRIDHVFTAGAPWQASAWVVDQWGYGDPLHYTSDHFAIAVELAVP